MPATAQAEKTKGGSKWGGARPNSGRHRKDCTCERCEARRAAEAHTDVDPAVSKTITLRESEWQWLALWAPGAPESCQLRDVVDRGKRFWPAGPQTCNATSKAKQREMWEQLADELGLDTEARAKLLSRHAPMLELLMGGTR